MAPSDIQRAPDLLERFESALAWLTELGLTHAPWMPRAAEALHFLCVQRTREERAGLIERYHEALYLRQEATDFIRIHQTFRDEADMVRVKLHNARQSSSSVLDEVGKGQARDLVAELSFGALLRHAGYDTTHAHTTDLLLTLKPYVGRPAYGLAIEVKRPQRDLRAAVDKAAYQIQQAVRSGPLRNPLYPHTVAAGVIVVIVDRLMPKPTLADLMIIREREDAKHYHFLLLENFIQAHRADLGVGRQYEGVLGVHVWWRTLCLIPHPEHPGDGLWSDFSQPRKCMYSANPEAILINSILDRALIWSAHHTP